MKKEDIPQDHSPLVNHFRELCYARDNDGNYTTGLSTGWEVKTVALEQAWEEIKLRIEETLEEIKAGTKTPLAYFMELRLMDSKLLAQYAGIWHFRVKKHLNNPSSFKKLTKETLAKYAKALDTTVEELTQFNHA
jgi:glutathionyl-hydroquinone reductase